MRFVKTFAVLMFFSVLFAACSQSSEKNKPVALQATMIPVFPARRIIRSSGLSRSLLILWMNT